MARTTATQTHINALDAAIPPLSIEEVFASALVVTDADARYDIHETKIKIIPILLKIGECAGMLCTLRPPAAVLLKR